MKDSKKQDSSKQLLVAILTLVVNIICTLATIYTIVNPEIEKMSDRLTVVSKQIRSDVEWLRIAQEVDEATRYADAGGNGKEDALKIFHGLATNLLSKMPDSFRGSMIEDAERDYDNKNFDDALRKYKSEFRQIVERKRIKVK